MLDIATALAHALGLWMLSSWIANVVAIAASR